jgi:hypothetical protein
MANLKFDKDIAALLVIDPYNDFISEGGKVWSCRTLAIGFWKKKPKETSEALVNFL